MSITIPRADIHAIAKRHGVDYDLNFDPPVEWVRATAKSLRADLQVAEADDLDALVDRVENERDAHCIAYSHDPDTGKCVCGHADDVHDRGLGQCEAPLNAEASA